MTAERVATTNESGEAHAADQTETLIDGAHAAMTVVGATADLTAPTSTG